MSIDTEEVSLFTYAWNTHMTLLDAPNPKKVHFVRQVST